MSDDPYARIAELEAELRQSREHASVARSEMEALRQREAALQSHLTATADVLRLIASAPADMQLVLDTIVETAARLCDAAYGVLWSRHGDLLRCEAAHGQVRAAPDPTMPLDRGSFAGRAVIDGRRIVTDDMAAISAEEYPRASILQRQRGHRAALGVPLKRAGEAIGSITFGRLEPRPFSAAEINLVETFADQAVIAIENARLFEELQESYRQVSEALQQQTATAEILRVIASTPDDRAGVLDAVVASARRLCGADVASVARVDGDEHALIASTDPALAGHRSRADGTIAQRTILAGHTISFAGTPDEQAATFPDRPQTSRAGPFGAVAMTPLLRDGRAIGTLNIARRAVRAFDAREISLLEMFANQAVIAIENARLFSELEQRNADLNEALEQQTATAEVLRAIASSPTDLQAVLDTDLRGCRALVRCRRCVDPSA